MRATEGPDVVVKAMEPGSSPDSSAVLHPSRRRVHSINFEAATDDWLESLVNPFRRAGLPKAGRSEVVRVALSELQRTLALQSSAETVKFFLYHDVEWRLAPIHSDSR
jgi:hypothetical protein